jgi:Protein of unknown function (DUF2567)
VGRPGFTEAVSSSPTVPSDAPDAPGVPDAAGPALPARRPWSPWREARAEWRTLLTLLLGLAVLGVPFGALWWALAPRADFRVTANGPVPIGNPSDELLVADDVVFVLLLAALGLLAGLGVWLVRRSRGVAGLLGVAFGTLAAGAVAWQVGELLGPGPTAAALKHVGGRVTTGLTLDSLPALAAGPFFAVLVYVVGALAVRSDGLGRSAAASSPARSEDSPSAR